MSDIFLQLVGRSREVNHAFLLEPLWRGLSAPGLDRDVGRHFQELAATGLPLKPGAIELPTCWTTCSLPRAIATSSTHATVQANLLVHSLTDSSTA